MLNTTPLTPIHNYASYIYEKYPRQKFHFWDFMNYNSSGELCINDVCINEIIKAVGTPLRIIFPEIASQRAIQWEKLALQVATEQSYGNALEFYYATKASPTAAITTAALEAGWNLETSSEQDLFNIKELIHTRHFPKNRRIVCNGYKPHPERYNTPDVSDLIPKGITFTGDIKQARRRLGHSYAEMVVEIKTLGIDIVPVFDSADELDYFAQPDNPSMNVGIRLKSYGLVKARSNLGKLVSRHGMDVETVFDVADRISITNHLTFDTFHAMIGANESIPPEEFVKNLLMVGEIYFQLKHKHPTLSCFNMGGSIPPLGFGYDHRHFLELLFSGFKSLADKHQLAPPVFAFELGNLIAAEAGIFVTAITSEKQNDSSGIPWGIIDGSIFRSAIDMILISKKDYILLAGNHAHSEAKWIRIGDRTCDGDGYARTNDDNLVAIPDPNLHEPNYGSENIIVMLGVEAYERTLTGYDGVGHCGLLEPIDITVFHDKNQHIVCVVDENKTPQQAASILGFNKINLKNLFTR